MLEPNLTNETLFNLLKQKNILQYSFSPPYTVHNGNNTSVSTKYIVKTIHLKSYIHYTDLNFVIQIQLHNRFSPVYCLKIYMCSLNYKTSGFLD